jgi:regulatory protein
LTDTAEHAAGVDPEDSDGAVEKALRILNAAGQTRSGLARKLTRAGYARATVEAACDRLEAMGYVDDRAYAEAALRRRQQQGRGLKVIGAELRHKGIEPELIDELLGEVKTEDEVQRAAELAVKLLRRHQGEPATSRREKVMGTLMRRGYAPWVARKALEAAPALDS